MNTRRVTVRSAPLRAVVYLIQLYRHLMSPLRPPTCRFMPTCSQYAVEALTEYGLVRGGWLAAARLAKCGPWHRGGWDPIPERPGETEQGPRPEDAAESWRSPAERGESERLVV